MFVSKGAKGAFVLFIHKASGPIELGDFSPQAANEPEVSSFKLDELAQFDQSGRPTAYDFLAGCFHRPGVEVHGAGEVETALDGSLNCN